MNNAARQVLCQIISRYTAEIINDPKRCEAVLGDLCAGHRRETFALTGALKCKIPDEISRASCATPIDVLLSRLAQKLENELGFTPENARWSVDSWALALGRINADQCVLTGSPSSVSTGDSESDLPVPVSPQEVVPVISHSRNPVLAAGVLFGSMVAGMALGLAGAPGVQKPDIQGITKQLETQRSVLTRISASLQKANNELLTAKTCRQEEAAALQRSVTSENQIQDQLQTYKNSRLVKPLQAQEFETKKLEITAAIQKAEFEQKLTDEKRKLAEQTLARTNAEIDRLEVARQKQEAEKLAAQQAAAKKKAAKKQEAKVSASARASSNRTSDVRPGETSEQAARRKKRERQRALGGAVLKLIFDAANRSEGD